MGQFANTLFSILLGWVQTAVSWLWALITNVDVSAWLRWLLDNWLALTVLLCLGGVVIDFLVYLLRWQPYRVWGSFLRRLTGKDQPDERADTADQPVFQRRWVYADGSTTVEEVPQYAQELASQEEQIAPIRPARRVAKRATLEQSYHQPVYPPQWQHNTQDEQGDNE